MSNEQASVPNGPTTLEDQASRIYYGADTFLEYFHVLSKQPMPSVLKTIPGQNGLVSYGVRGDFDPFIGGDLDYWMHWNPVNGDITVSPANSHKIKPNANEIDRRIVEQAAPLAAAILYRLTDRESLLRYRDPEDVAKAVSAFDTLIKAHDSAKVISAVALGLKKDELPESTIEQYALGKEGMERMDKLREALRLYDENGEITEAVKSVLPNLGQPEPAAA